MIPGFAVVGHPNKGKSSIVATLAHDDRVAISPQSGTTRVTETFTARVGNSQYRLVDTPGFQRPRKVLQWLESHADSADQRAHAVKQLVEDEDCQKRFPDEVQLLRPIVEGAAILYVVDGSRPYGPEYEAEMEILRWTGQASMALINPIENEQYIESWRQALSQYFKVVTVFNAVQADSDKQLAILETFSHLKEEWRGSIQTLVREYRAQREEQERRAAQILADLLRDLCFHQVSQKTFTRNQAAALRDMLERRFYDWMKNRERKAFDELKLVYQYHNLESDIYDLPFQDNLFDTEQWVLWGLNRQQLTGAAAMSGAAAGAIIDAGLLGHSLMAGAVGGAILAGGGAWFGATRIADFKIKGLPVGGYEARQGPIQSRNFPYVVLGRFLLLEQALKHRNHARRDPIRVREGDLAAMLESLEKSQRKELHRAMGRLSRQQEVENLESILRPLV